MVDFSKTPEAGKKKSRTTQKRKGSLNTKTEQITVLLNSGVEGSVVNSKDVSSSKDTPAWPSIPDPLPNTYVLTLLRFCHKHVSTYYGCGASFLPQGYPEVPNDLIIVSKTHRSYMDPVTHKKKRKKDRIN